MQIMAYGDLTYFGASRAANCLFPEIGDPIRKCVFDICGHTLTTASQWTQVAPPELLTKA